MEFAKEATRPPLISRRMSAAQQWHSEKKLRRLPQLLIGLCGYGTALALLVQSGLGATSWTILAEGISSTTGLTFGWSVNLISVAVLFFWIPLKEIPGLGTVLNVALVGLSADVATSFLPLPTTLPVQLTYFLAGTVLLALFDAVYLGARFGSGPRDGLMTGAVRLTGRPLWLVRTVIDVIVATTGWALGGQLGFGTVVLALAMGPLVQLFLPFTSVNLRSDVEPSLGNSAKEIGSANGLPPQLTSE